MLSCFVAQESPDISWSKITSPPAPDQAKKAVKPTKGQIHKRKTKQVSQTPPHSVSSPARTQRVEEDRETAAASRKKDINLVTRKKKSARSEESHEEVLSEDSSNDWPVSEELFNMIRGSKTRQPKEREQKGKEQKEREQKEREQKERDDRLKKQVAEEEERAKRERKKEREKRERERMEDIEKGKSALRRAMQREHAYNSTSELEDDVEIERARKRRKEDVGGIGARTGESARVPQTSPTHRSSLVSEARAENEYSQQTALDLVRMELKHETGVRQRMEEEMRILREYNRELVDLRVSSARAEGEVQILKIALADAKESLREAKNEFWDLSKAHASREDILRRDCAEQIKTMQGSLMEKYTSREDALRRDVEVEIKRLIADAHEKDRALSEARKRHNDEMTKLHKQLELMNSENQTLMIEGKEFSQRIDQLERDLDAFKRHGVDARKND